LNVGDGEKVRLSHMIRFEPQGVELSPRKANISYAVFSNREICPGANLQSQMRRQWSTASCISIQYCAVPFTSRPVVPGQLLRVQHLATQQKAAMKRKTAPERATSTTKRARPSVPEYHLTKPKLESDGSIQWPAPRFAMDTARRLILDW
jgi:hypothetical protein